MSWVLRIDPQPIGPGVLRIKDLLIEATNFVDRAGRIGSKFLLRHQLQQTGRRRRVAKLSHDLQQLTRIQIEILILKQLQQKLAGSRITKLRKPSITFFAINLRIRFAGHRSDGFKRRVVLSFYQRFNGASLHMQWGILGQLLQ